MLSLTGAAVMPLSSPVRNDRSHCRVHVAVAGVLTMLGLPVHAQSYSVSGDFSALSNPAGAWTYGWLTALGGSFTTYTQAVTYAGTGGSIQAWDSPSLGTDPGVFDNPNAMTSAFIAANNLLPGGWAGFHPGSGGQLSDFRFTAPSDGSYRIALSFQGADTIGTTTDVHVFTGTGSLFSASINGYGAASLQSFDQVVSLVGGQTVDIAVGYGGNGYLYDLTAVQGTISAVPEPSAVEMLLVGLGVAGAWRRLQMRCASRGRRT